MTENKNNYFFWNKPSFENAVRKFVCPQCPYDAAAGCANPDPHGCAIFRRLPDLVRIAQRLEKLDLEKYREAVGREISFYCEHGNSPDCSLPDTPECGLDRLLPFVLKAVVKTDKGLESRPASEV